MKHNFQTKHPLVPNLEPQWKVGDTVKISSKQHVHNGFVGVITKIYPNQSNVFYILQDKLETITLTSIPERMLEKVEE